LQRRPSLLRHPHTLLGILHRRPVSDAARRNQDAPHATKPPGLGRNHRHRHRRPSLRRQHRLPRIHRPTTSHWRSTVPTLRFSTPRHRYLLVGITETSTPHGRLVICHLPLALATDHRSHLPNRILHLAIQNRGHRTDLHPVSRLTTIHRRPHAPCQTIQNTKTRLHTHGLQHGHHRSTDLLHPTTPSTRHQPRSRHRRMHRRQRPPQQLRQQRTRRPTRNTPNTSPTRSRRTRLHRMYCPRRLHRLRPHRVQPRSI